MYISASASTKDNIVYVWERTEAGRLRKKFAAPYYFFVADNTSTSEYRDIYGRSLLRLDFNDYASYKQAIDSHKSRGINMYESDIRPEYKILAEHYYESALPTTHFTFYDIEVDYDKQLGYSDVESYSAPINAIALHHYWSKEDYVLVVPPPNRSSVTNKDLSINAEYPNVKLELFKSERELLARFLILIEDSDIISGWNSAYFDTPYVYERLKRCFSERVAARLSFPGAPPPKYREVFDKNGLARTLLDTFGRESVDYLELFRKFEVTERHSFSLEAVSEEKFPDLKKLEYEGSLYDLYRNDFEHFIRYNIRDCEILKALEDDLGYMQLAIQFAHSSTGLMRDVTGTIKLAELAIINFCHHNLGARVQDSNYGDVGDVGKFTGALVLPPRVGMHDWVASVDVASLYPSAIRALNISPETIVGQFLDNHAAFSAIEAESEERLALRYETGAIEDRSAREWRQYLLAKSWAVSGHGSVFSMNQNGVIPTILADWFEQRKVFKKLASDAMRIMHSHEKQSSEYATAKHEYDTYHRLQYIFKIRLNSLYGALGNKYFKFYDVRLAESTTRTGQEILMHMVKTVASCLDGAYAYPSESTIYSDTDSCYFLTHASNINDAIKIGGIVERKVNASFPGFCARAFLCREEYANFIRAELDVVASKSIFIKKKYYVMQLGYADGALTDKMKLMGVQLKKTTLPKLISKTLTALVQDLLRGRPWRDLGADIIAYRKYIATDAPLELIGLPKGIKGLQEKEDEYLRGNTKVLLSGHAAAAIFYNICLGVYNDTESFKIKSGMKIRTYYLSKKIGRFTSIALPSDLTRIPSWFTEHFANLIDRERQAEVLIDKPLSSILAAIGKSVPSDRSLLFDELAEYD